jgi:cytochrome c oxidase assembly protein subunit 15
MTARSARSAAAADKAAPRAVALWLFACCGLIFLMVVVGGMTRLTLSGLSITEWNPVIGVVPPLTHAQWAAEFERYRQIPEYRAVHYGMSLGDFKTIFFWEYSHRLLGRLIGVVFAVPLLWFWASGRLPRGLAPALAGILALGFAQGLLGWYMVESGLSHRIEVSQYRLVAHLALALLIYSLILWTALGLLKDPRRGGRDRVSSADRSRSSWPGLSRLSMSSPSSPGASLWMPGSSPGMTDDGGSRRDRAPLVWRRGAEALVALVGLTIAAGGFVAGTRAGFVYNTFPLMGGHFVPSEYARLAPLWRNWFENVAAVQFDHRVLAMATAAAVLLLWISGRRAVLPKPARLALYALLAVVAIQVTLGVSTLLLVVPVPLAAAHQAGAVLLLTAAIVLRHTLRRAKGRSTA